MTRKCGLRVTLSVRLNCMVSVSVGTRLVCLYVCRALVGERDTQAEKESRSYRQNSQR